MGLYTFIIFKIKHNFTFISIKSKTSIIGSLIILMGVRSQMLLYKINFRTH